MSTERNFDAALQSFFAGCQRIHSDYITANFTNVKPADDWRMDMGPKYVRVVGNGSAHCFVSRETGDVLKCAGWKAPAKHARGNIYDDHGGLKFMGPYGPAYLR